MSILMILTYREGEEALILDPLAKELGHFQLSYMDIN